jgi:hypothetical protein
MVDKEGVQRKVLPPLQILGRFDFSKFIYFAMHLNTHCLDTQQKKTIYLEKPKQTTIWNGGSTRPSKLHLRRN